MHGLAGVGFHNVVGGAEPDWLRLPCRDANALVRIDDSKKDQG